MTELESRMAHLHRLFEPWDSAPSGTVIWAPEESDPNREFKRTMISRANEVIAEGEKALAGGAFRIPSFGEADFSEIQDALSADPEARSFIELAAACESVTQSLSKIGT